MTPLDQRSIEKLAEQKIESNINDKNSKSDDTTEVDSTESWQSSAFTTASDLTDDDLDSVRTAKLPSFVSMLDSSSSGTVSSIRLTDSDEESYSSDEDYVKSDVTQEPVSTLTKIAHNESDEEMLSGLST